MASLLGQIAAVVAVGLLVGALIARTGARLPLPQTVALGALLVLAFTAVSTYRETWHQLDLQREQWSENTPEAAISECAGSLGVDPHYVGWLKARIPENATYHQPPGPSRGYAPDLCLRMLLLPRMQVERPEGSRHVIVWDAVDPALLDRYRSEGAKVERYTTNRWLVTLP